MNKISNKILIIIVIICMFVILILGFVLPIIPFQPQIYDYHGRIIKRIQIDTPIPNESIIHVLKSHNDSFWIDDSNIIRIPLYIALDSEYMHNLTKKSLDKKWLEEHQNYE